MIKFFINFLMVVLSVMLVVRSGIFVVRIIQEIGQTKQVWQPANEREELIWKQYQEVK